MVIQNAHAETLHGSVAVIVPLTDGILDLIAGIDQQIDLPIADNSQFNGLPMDVVNVSNVGAFPPKQIFGDYNRTSHQILSSFGQVSWAGGGQRENSQESSDVDRYAKIASLETRFPHGLTLLPRTHVITGPNTTGAHILGDLLVGANRQTYVSYGLEAHRISSTTTVHIADFDNTPLGVGRSFRTAGTPILYVPFGANGYSKFDGTTAGAATHGTGASAAPLNFVVHEKKLWQVDVNGNVLKSVDGTAWTLVTQIEADYLPRGMVVYFDRAEELVPHVVTDSMVFSIDETDQVAYETDLNYAPHPSAGVAFERWRTDLYVAIGLGIQRYTGTTINATGLDRDDGPGFEWSGDITALTKGFNDLFVGVTGAAAAGVDVIDIQEDYQAEPYITASASRSYVMRINGSFVPHTLWVAPENGGAVHDLFVSTAGGSYRLYWTWKGNVYYQNLSVGFDNPAQNPTQEFEQSGELTSPWLDMGMPIDHMTLAAIEFEVKAASATEKITVDFQINNDDVLNLWRPVAVLTAPGHYEVRVGLNGTLPDNTPRYDGVGFSRMRYRIKMERDPADPLKRPVLEALILAFIKRMRRIKSFDMTIDCSSDYGNDARWGLNNRQRARMLDQLIEWETFIPFGHRDIWLTVKMAYANGAERTGNDARGDKTISLIMPYEVPLGGV